MAGGDGVAHALAPPPPPSLRVIDDEGQEMTATQLRQQAFNLEEEARRYSDHLHESTVDWGNPSAEHIARLEAMERRARELRAQAREMGEA